MPENSSSLKTQRHILITAVLDHVPERTTAGSLTILYPYSPICTGGARNEKQMSFISCQGISRSAGHTEDPVRHGGHLPGRQWISLSLPAWKSGTPFRLSRGQTGKVNAVEAFTVKTSKRKTVPYDFGEGFPQVPALPQAGGHAQESEGLLL